MTFFDFNMDRHDARPRLIAAMIDRRMDPILQLSDTELKRNYRLDSGWKANKHA
jgi:hypothetical protein